MSKNHRSDGKKSTKQVNIFNWDALQSVAVPIENLSEHQLLNAVKTAGEAMFAELLSRYRNNITNCLYRFLNDDKKAVELAQENFVRLFFGIER